MLFSRFARRLARRSGPAALVSSVALALVGGCSSEPPIEKYQVARTSPPRQPLDVEAEQAKLDHMLAAILIHKDSQQAWFFKLVVPAARVADLREPFETFLTSVRLEGDRLAWELPSNWKALPGDENRFATITVPVEDQPRDLTVTKLPFAGDEREFIAANVNRWLGQLGEQPQSAQQIATLGQSIDTAAGPAMVFELIGVMPQSDAMMPPGHPPISASGGAPQDQIAAAPAEGLQFDAPEDWKPGRMSAMRKAAFIVEDARGAAEVTVMSFPGQPGVGMGEVLGNVRRWAGEVGLSSLSDEQLAALAEDRTVGGFEGTYVELLGPEGEKPQATLVALVPRDGQIWFFKIRGDRTTVEAQHDAFAKFLNSVEFE